MVKPSVSMYADLAATILQATPRCGAVRLVAIDGHGGAGKSVFAERLARALGGAPVVHTDDFASWEQPIGWWGRFEDELLRPLGRGEHVWFRPWDWGAGRLGEPKELPPSDVVVVEGVSSSRAAVADRLVLAVWIETARPERFRRGIERDGPEAEPQWEQWGAEEDAHFASDGTKDRADVVVDGAPSIAHEAEAEFIRLR